MSFWMVCWAWSEDANYFREKTQQSGIDFMNNFLNNLGAANAEKRLLLELFENVGISRVASENLKTCWLTVAKNKMIEIA